MENYKLKENIKMFEGSYENGKVIKFGDIAIQKQKFYQHKGQI